MILSDRFNEYYLTDFEEIGGKWETIEVTKRTQKYTDRFCRLSFEGIEEYTHIRFYKNGLAMIGEPFIDIKTGKKITRTDPQITTRMDKILFDVENRKNINPTIIKRYEQETLYRLSSIIAWFFIMGTTILAYMGMISIMKCCIGVILILLFLLSKRKIWHEKIILIGSDVKNYYERYK